MFKDALEFFSFQSRYNGCVPSVDTLYFARRKQIRQLVTMCGGSILAEEDESENEQQKEAMTEQKRSDEGIKEARVLIVASPGSGKTSILQRLAAAPTRQNIRGVVLAGSSLKHNPELVRAVRNMVKYVLPLCSCDGLHQHWRLCCTVPIYGDVSECNSVDAELPF